MPDRAEDETRFRRLLEANRRRMIGIARSYARGAEAGELYREMLLQIWKYRAGLKGLSDRSTRVYRLALNTALTYRHQLSRPAADEEAAAAAENGDEDLGALRRYLDELDRADRAIFLMYLDDLTHQQTAEVTGLSVSQVGVKIHRLKQSFIDRHVTS